MLSLKTSQSSPSKIELPGGLTIVEFPSVKVLFVYDPNPPEDEYAALEAWCNKHGWFLQITAEEIIDAGLKKTN